MQKAKLQTAAMQVPIKAKGVPLPLLPTHPLTNPITALSSSSTHTWKICLQLRSNVLYFALVCYDNYKHRG